MADKVRSDKAKNIGKVAEVIAVDPNKTVREIGEETGMGASTASRAKQELAQSGTKDETISYIVGASKENLRDFARLMRAKMKKVIEENLDIEESGEAILKQGKDLGVNTLVELNKIAKEDMARITVLGGNITESDGGLKEISDKQLSAIETLKNMFL